MRIEGLKLFLIPQELELLDYVDRNIAVTVPLSLTEPQAGLDLCLASLHEELLFVSVLDRVQLIVLDFEVPLDVRDGLQEHEGHRMREALLKDAIDHAVLDEFGVTVFAQLAHNVQMLDE